MVTFRLHANKDTRLPLFSRWKFFLSKQHMLPDYRIIFPKSVRMKEIKCKLECHDFPSHVSVYEDSQTGWEAGRESLSELLLTERLVF